MSPPGPAGGVRSLQGIFLPVASIETSEAAHVQLGVPSGRVIVGAVGWLEH